MWVKNCIKHRLSLMDGCSSAIRFLYYNKGCYPQQRWSDCVCTGGKPRLRLLAEQTRQQRNQGDAHQSDTAASHELFYPQLGVKTLLDGGRRRTKNLYGVFKRTVPAGQVRQ